MSNAKIAIITRCFVESGARGPGADDREGEMRACRFVAETGGGQGRAGPVPEGSIRQSRGRVQKGAVGQSPGGRQPGSRNKATEMAELLLEGEAEALTRKAVELALAGDAV